jgi:hypothetical protein
VSPAFRRTSSGAIELVLRTEERELLRALPGELRLLYEAGPDDADPVRSRLFPRAYLDPTAEDAEREWRDLVHPELVRDRLAALDTLLASLESAGAPSGGEVVLSLDAGDVDALLSVLNDARLALGTRIGVTEDLDYDDLDPDDPHAPEHAAYAWLTYVEGELVETLLSGMPD